MQGTFELEPTDLSLAASVKHAERFETHTIVVDLDGTLLPVDTLHESLVLALRRGGPGLLLRIPFWLLEGKAEFKRRVSEVARLDARLLPYNEDVLAYVQSERKSGKQIVLATAADRSIAEAVSQHLELFDDVLASECGANLEGRGRLAAIRERLGDRPFVYVGNSADDLPIWAAASSAVIVGCDTRLAKRVRDVAPSVEKIETRSGGWRDALRAMRVYQWIKNLLVFVPLLTSLQFMRMDALLDSMLAFLAFGFLASAGYIANDILDVNSDREHPRKRLRPVASGRLRVGRAALIAGLSLVTGMVMSAQLGSIFILVGAAYLVSTFTYSLILKRYVFVDIIALAVLYTTRLLAGAVAIEVTLSVWLLGFSVLIFCSLALVKRVAELLLLRARGGSALVGRDYQVADVPVLVGFGAGAAVSAIVVFILFATTSEHQQRFPSFEFFWPGALCLLYWQARMWIKTMRGEMSDDPIVFTVRDRGSRLTVLALAVLFLAAAYVTR